MSEITCLSATELAERILDRSIRSAEAVEAFLSRIEARNPGLNALVTLDEASARRQARQADRALDRDEPVGPFHGVPFTVKDCWETAGLRTTCGYPPLEDHVPDGDATAVARLREAGAVLLGKSNPAMLAADWQTDNPIFGRTTNPWDPSRTPGGSSGGSGAAVAAGLSPLDLASDSGGSIRVPSHFCGVAGLKPTEGRVPSRGHVPDWHLPGREPKGLLRHMGVYGPIARSVEDLRLCFSVLAGRDPREPGMPPVPPADPPPREPGSLRIAWTGRFGEAPLGAETTGVLEDVAGKLEAAGAEVERVEPDLPFEVAWRTWGEIAAAEIGAGMPLWLRGMFLLRFLSMADRSSPPRKGLKRGISLGGAGLVAALARRDETIRGVDRVLEGRDAWLCPVAATPAFEHRKPGAPIPVDGVDAPYVLAAAGYTTPFSLSGHPVVALPVGRTPAGLPVGVQVVGRRWEDERLLAVAEALEGIVPAPGSPPGPSGARNS